MRWLFLFLFLLNLIYIGWEMSRSPSENYADVPALKNVKRISLLSELKPPIDLAETKTAQANDVRAENSAAKQIDSEKIAKQVKKEKAEAVLEVAEQVAASEDVKPSVESEAAKSKPAKAEHVKASSIKKPSITTKSQKSKLQKTITTNISQAAKCFTLGPFRDLGKLRSLTREIKSYVIEADFRGREEREQSLYWVYIKPEKNQAAAIEIGKRLKAKKIKDFYVIRDGEKINGLSLGHFRNKKGAYGLAKKVKRLGFNVIVEPVFKTYTLYWLDYQVASGAKIPESVFDKHIKKTKKNDISRLSRDCGV